MGPATLRFLAVAQSVKPADAGVSIGQVFQGKYRVEAILGHGGMGVVAECTHLALNERVAIKMLRQDVMLDQDAVQRFIREAQAAVKLKSEYVARVSDVGTFENGTPYMVMEYLEGHDLGELIKQRGVLPAQWAVELMLQTAEALAEAHSLGIVHRDVKPTNLFVTWRPDGTALIKVLDFGISKSPMGTDMQLTQTQSLLGTPAYMSPEQMRSARLVDTRTDIWSLGTVFYEILEGRRPFEAESFSEMCVKVAVDPPTPMVNTPPPIQQVILRCLAKGPEQRYNNMADFARDLVPFAADPHQAQMLVERMSRMLRRSQYDWEGSSTGVGRPAIPSSARDIGSGPVRTPLPDRSSPQWGLGSDPAAAPWNVKSDPAAAPWNAKSDPQGRPWHGQTPRGDASQPFARPLPGDHQSQSQPFAKPLPDDPSAGVASSTVNTRKSRWPIVIIALLALTGGAIALGVSMSSDKETQANVEPQQAPDTTTNMGTGSDTKADTTDTKAATDTAVPTVTDTKTGSDTKTGTDLTGTKTGTGKTGTKTGTGKTGTGKTGTGKTGTGKSDTKQTTKTGAGSADPAATTTTTTDHKVETKPICDPFSSMHSCSK